MQGNAIFEHSLGSSNPLAIYRIYCFPGLSDVLALQGAVAFFWSMGEHGAWEHGDNQASSLCKKLERESQWPQVMIKLLTSSFKT